MFTLGKLSDVPMTVATIPQIDILQSVELFASRIITDEFSEKIVFHDIKYVHGVIRAIEEIGTAEGLTEEEMEITKLAGWFNYVGFRDLPEFKRKQQTRNSLYKNCALRSIEIARDYLQRKGYPEYKLDTVILTMKEGGFKLNLEASKMSAVLADSITAYLAKPKSRKNIELLYREFLLNDIVEESRAGFYENAIAYVNSHRYVTDYAIKYLEPAKLNLTRKLEKRKKALDQNEKLALKKELDISDAEFKKLKKNLKKVQGRDDRGIQTMFRTTSRNHYTLNEMVDKKANIMISINAIVISVIVGRIVGHGEIFCIHNVPMILLLIISTASIFNAVLAIRPAVTHGEFTEEEVRNKKGNLLYFGNYHNMSQRDYTWGVLQMLNDSDYLYSSLIKDQYFLGQLLAKKYKFIRKSLTLFIIGFVITVATFLIIEFLGQEFHIGSAAIGGHGIM